MTANPTAVIFFITYRIKMSNRKRWIVPAGVTPTELDEKMLSLNEAIQECIEHQANRDNMNDVLNNVIGSGPEQKSLNHAGEEK